MKTLVESINASINEAIMSTEPVDALEGLLKLIDGMATIEISKFEDTAEFDGENEVPVMMIVADFYDFEPKLYKQIKKYLKDLAKASGREFKYDFWSDGKLSSFELEIENGDAVIFNVDKKYFDEHKDKFEKILKNYKETKF